MPLTVIARSNLDREALSPAAGDRLFDRFEPSAGGYHPVNSYLTMLASMLVHPAALRTASQDVFKRRACSLYQRWGFSTFRFVNDDDTDTELVIASKRDMVMIVFRGSELNAGVDSSFDDWIKTDANLPLVSSGTLLGGAPGRVHRGFGTATNKVFSRIAAELGRKEVGAVPGGGKPVFVTGHSLGAALATLTAYRLVQDGFPAGSLYLHASPRVGDAEFARHFGHAMGGRVYRTVRRRDPVPELPPEILGYVHVPSVLRYFDENGNVHGAPPPLPVLPSIGEHNTFKYSLALFNAIPKSTGTPWVPPNPTVSV